MEDYEIKEMYTDERITRYVAFDNQKTIVINANTEFIGGFDKAVYSERVKNKKYEGIEDGIYGEIVSYQGIDWQLDISLTIPAKFRKQYRHVKRYSNLADAIKDMKDKIREYRELMSEGIK